MLQLLHFVVLSDKKVVRVCVCEHDDLTITADISFLLGNFRDQRKLISDGFACQVHRLRSRSFCQRVQGHLGGYDLFCQGAASFHL